MHPMFTLGSMLVHENLRTLASIARSVKLLLVFCAVGRSVAVLAIDVPTGHSDDPDARKRTRRGMMPLWYCLCGITLAYLAVMVALGDMVSALIVGFGLSIAVAAVFTANRIAIPSPNSK